jgi:hypothetical protein
MQLNAQAALVTVFSVHGDASQASYRCRHENGIRTDSSPSYVRPAVFLGRGVRYTDLST